MNSNQASAELTEQVENLHADLRKIQERLDSIAGNADNPAQAAEVRFVSFCTNQVLQLRETIAQFKSILAL